LINLCFLFASDAKAASTPAASASHVKLVRALFRGLLKHAKVFDAHPVLKALISVESETIKSIVSAAITRARANPMFLNSMRTLLQQFSILNAINHSFVHLCFFLSFFFCLPGN
jgi:hypothetical protein